jgi:hypothetical protein
MNDDDLIIPKADIERVIHSTPERVSTLRKLKNLEDENDQNFFSFEDDLKYES